jgi:hypothetical protein
MDPPAANNILLLLPLKPEVITEDHKDKSEDQRETSRTETSHSAVERTRTRIARRTRVRRTDNAEESE